ncbi:hypothetical protein QW131_01240 [Roseibium salinum]|nr:hypothetical protein [Roseibium salinum]
MFTTLVMRWPVRSWKLQASKNLDHLVLNIAGEFRVLTLHPCGKGVGGFVDEFRRGQDCFRRPFGADHHGVQFIGDAGHFLALGTGGVVQGRDFLLGLGNRFIDGVQLDLQLACLGQFLAELGHELFADGLRIDRRLLGLPLLKQGFQPGDFRHEFLVTAVFCKAGAVIPPEFIRIKLSARKDLFTAAMPSPVPCAPAGAFSSQQGRL